MTIGAPIAPEGSDWAAAVKLRDAVRAEILQALRRARRLPRSGSRIRQASCLPRRSPRGRRCSTSSFRSAPRPGHRGPSASPGARCIGAEALVPTYAATLRLPVPHTGSSGWRAPARTSARGSRSKARPRREHRGAGSADRRSTGERGHVGLQRGERAASVISPTTQIGPTSTCHELAGRERDRGDLRLHRPPSAAARAGRCGRRARPRAR